MEVTGRCLTNKQIQRQRNKQTFRQKKQKYTFTGRRTNKLTSGHIDRKTKNRKWDLKVHCY